MYAGLSFGCLEHVTQIFFSPIEFDGLNELFVLLVAPAPFKVVMVAKGYDSTACRGYIKSM